MMVRSAGRPGFEGSSWDTQDPGRDDGQFGDCFAKREDAGNHKVGQGETQGSLQPHDSERCLIEGKGLLVRCVRGMIPLRWRRSSHPQVPL